MRSGPVVTRASRRNPAWLVAVLSILLAIALDHPIAEAASPRWVHGGPYGAAVVHLATSPGGSSTFYAASYHVIYRSDDGGVSWVTGPTDLYYPNMAVSAQDPSVVYAGDGFHVEKTMDGGFTWTVIENGLPSAGAAIAVDPASDLVAYVDTSQGLYKTTDGGASWFAATTGLPPGGGRPAVAQGDPALLLAGTSDGLYKSEDGGGTWFPSSDGLPGGLVGPIVTFDPTDAQKAYVTVAGDLYRSTDQGATWSFSRDGVTGLAPSVAEPGTLFAGTWALDPYSVHGVSESTDAGTTWHVVNRQVNARAIAVDPVASGVVYVATGDELGVLKSVDHGSRWRPSDANMLGTHVGVLAVDPSDGSVAYASTAAWGGVYKTTNAGRSWALASRGLHRVADSLAVTPSDANIVYAGLDVYSPVANKAGVYRSDDGGTTWRPANRGIADSAALALAVDPTDPDLAYAGVEYYCDECQSGTVWKTLDGGATWVRAHRGLVDLPYTSIVVSPSDPQVVFAAASDVISRSLDGGRTWTRKDNGIGDAYSIAALAIDPVDPSIVYAVTEYAGIFGTTDEGAHWSLLSTDPSYAYDLQITDSGHLCAGTDHGVLCSIDGGRTWTQLPGLSAGVLSLALGPHGDFVYAGTDGGGVGVRRG